MRTADEYAAAARENFLAGYNCAQSVLLAFAGEIGETPERALRLASPLGAGMGRLRQVCGALSAAFLVEGALRGYADPADAGAKAALYARTQKKQRIPPNGQHPLRGSPGAGGLDFARPRGANPRLLREAAVPEVHRVRRAPGGRNPLGKKGGRNLKKRLAFSVALW